MTSTPVMSSNMSPQVAWMNSTPNQQKADIGDFKNFMDSSKNDMNSEPETQRETTDKIDVHDERPSKVKSPKQEKATKTEPDENDLETVKDAVEQVKAIVKDELSISEEQLALALETLGLTPIDLLDTDCLTEVALELNGVENNIDLVTDENLYASVSELLSGAEEIVNEVCEELDVDFDSFEAALKEFKPADIKTPVKTQEVEEATSLEDKIFVEDTSFGTAKLHNFSLETKGEDTKEQSDDAFSFEDEAKPLEPTKENITRPVSFMEQLLEKTAKAFTDASSEISYTATDTENILNQITESIKLEVTTQTREISLRLHPESLGNVTVKVSANSEGILTAHFTASNESVKTIIENQAVVLRETLEAKGVTVEAVEVTIASHEFERNLNEENRGKESNNSSRKGIRRINLDSTEEESVSEEDTVVKEMMIQNGNTIDYTA